VFVPVVARNFSLFSFQTGINMAAAWLSVLKMVPWGDVISNAPKVTEGAKKLWGAVAGQGSAPEAPTPEPTENSGSQAQALSELAARLARAQAAIDGLHAQMLSSTELIQSLAEQNTQLIRRVEANRLRLRWLLVCNLVLGVALLLVLGIRFLPLT
jgi:hypothetical protein